MPRARVDIENLEPVYDTNVNRVTVRASRLVPGRWLVFLPGSVIPTWHPTWSDAIDYADSYVEAGEA